MPSISWFVSPVIGLLCGRTTSAGTARASNQASSRERHRFFQSHVEILGHLLRSSSWSCDRGYIHLSVRWSKSWRWQLIETSQGVWRA